MKKSSSRPGTLTKLFGKKTNSNNNSLYADNPPWILPKGAKKPSVDYHDDVLGTFSFLDDSGTATLKARPGPRVRPVLQFSNSNTETQGLAVPTPSVPSGFKENASIGNGPKLNGNYRMYSSVGDLRYNNNNYYEDDDEIPAPPSMPPPPPPSMPPPPPPPQESQFSSAVSSPASPSPPDFIPPTPNSSVPVAPNLVTAANPFHLTAGEQPMTNNVSKWKSETVLNAESKDLHLTLPNRFSFNPAASHHYGQTNIEVEPKSTLPKSFKVPPPAPTRTTSMQLQELQSTSYAKEPPKSPVPSSFNPSYQAKLHSASDRGQKSLNDTLNKRKSMLIMEDLNDLALTSGHKEDKAASVTDSMNSRPLSLNTTTALQHVALQQVELNQDSLSDNGLKLQPGINEFQKQSNKINSESLKPTIKVISLKPILGELSQLNTNVQSKHDSLTRKEKDTFARELERMENVKKAQLEVNSGDFYQESPPTPPPMPPPPPPPVMPPPNPPFMAPATTASPPAMPNITPPRTSTSMNPVAPPPAPLLSSIPKVPQASPLLSPKPKIVPISPAPPLPPPPPPPKAPPAAPPLPGPVPSTNPESQLPLLKALQEKQQTLKQVPKKSVDDMPAQRASISSEDQKNRVGKIKGELEALFSPKKGEGLEINKKNTNSNNSQIRGGENTLVNSLMLKVPLLPAKFEKDIDSDTSEWLPKTSKTDIQIPEPDYLPISPKNKMDKPTYSHVQNQKFNPTVETSVTSTAQDSPPKATNTANILSNDIPAYKPHHDRKASAGSWTFDPIVVSKPDTDVNIKPDLVLKTTDIESSAKSMKSESSISQNEASIKHTDKVESTSPMALLMAAKKRAEKVNRSPALESGNLPKVSVTSGLVTSSLSSLGNSNTFVVMPKKDPGEQLDQFEINSSRFNQNNDPSNKSNVREFQSPRSSVLDAYSEKNYYEKSSLLHVDNTTALHASTEDNNEVYYKRKSQFAGAPIFNISSVPSPIPPPMTEEEFEYGIIPPPAEFTNSPTIASNLSNMEQHANFYVQDSSSRYKSGLLSSYEENNAFNQPLTYNMSTSSRDFSKYTSDSYTGFNRDSNTGFNRDTNKGSLIKKRLYMPEPEPESTRNYGKTIGSLRSTALPKSYLHSQSGPNMVSDQRRYTLTSTYAQQGRRMSAENRIVPPMTDLKYKSTNSDYLVGKPPNKPQSTYQQGMTFTVRPGTRQPISQTYQGGYL